MGMTQATADQIGILIGEVDACSAEVVKREALLRETRIAILELQVLELERAHDLKRANERLADAKAEFNEFLGERVL